jgi:hypothetical protein
LKGKGKSQARLRYTSRAISPMTFSLDLGGAMVIFEGIVK